jgi:hypothetical protein
MTDKSVRSELSQDAVMKEVLFVSPQIDGRPPKIGDKAIDLEESTIGDLLDSIGEDYLGDTKATPCELTRIARVGVDLFCAAVAHRDVTPEVLQEARGEWGHLVRVARLILMAPERDVLDSDLSKDLTDLGLECRYDDPDFDELWAEYVTVGYGGDEYKAVEACRQLKAGGLRNPRGHVVKVVKVHRARRHSAEPPS